jgi:3-hydroxyacyl-CoA dehydrogenase
MLPVAAVAAGTVVVAACAMGRRIAAAAAAPPSTEVFRKFLRELKQLCVMIETSLHRSLSAAG